MIHDQKSFAATPQDGRIKDINPPHAKAAGAAAAYASDDADRIRRFTPLVRKLAWHLSGSAGASVDVDDLMQTGLVALTECARRHDRPTEDGFAAYAKMRIRGAMIDTIRKAHFGARSAAQTRRQLDNAASTLRQQLGREANDTELAGALGLGLDELAQMRDRSAAIRQSELSQCYDDTNTAFASDEPDAEALLIQHEDRQQLAAAIAALPERLQLVIQLYFLEELNLAEIAEVLEVSVPRVHQLKASAIGALRKGLEA